MSLHTTLEEDGGRASAESKGATQLCLCLEAERPSAGGASYDLSHVDAVEIGRGDCREVIDTHDSVGPVRRILVPDQRMSRAHVRIERVMGQWVLKDLGSRNGTLVDGERVDESGLRIGSSIQIGRSFFELVTCAAGPRSFPGGTPTFVPEFAEHLAALERVATTAVEVLVLGDSGTGKEVVGRWVHEVSGRGGPFVPVNCGAIPDNLVESELFGVRRGAFSGANEDREGWLRAASGGSLFLDEIAELPMASQAALLRVLQDREVVPVGGTVAVPSDFRLIAATHADLAERVASGAFRDDLYGRIAGYTVTIPPLRQRRADMGALIAAVLARVAPTAAHEVSFSLDAAQALMACTWPHNVRALEKCIAVSLALAAGGRIELDHLPPAVRVAPKVGVLAQAPPLRAEDAARRDAIVALLLREGGNVSAVARAMGKARTQLVRWLGRYDIDPDQYRS